MSGAWLVFMGVGCHALVIAKVPYGPQESRVAVAALVVFFISLLVLIGGALGFRVTHG